MLSNEVPRSSTTSATVRRTCEARKGTGGSGGAFLSAARSAGRALTVPVSFETKERFVISCGLPPTLTSKSSGRRSDETALFVRDGRIELHEVRREPHDV